MIILIIVLIFVAVIIIISVFIYLRKKDFKKDRKEKKQIKKDIGAPKQTKGKCPICGKEFLSFINEDQGFDVVTCNHCGRKLKRKKK